MIIIEELRNSEANLQQDTRDGIRTHAVRSRRITTWDIQTKWEMQGVSKRALQLLKLIYIYLEDMYSVLSYHNVAGHTEFYLG
jgi:hypothetical protein